MDWEIILEHLDEHGGNVEIDGLVLSGEKPQMVAIGEKQHEEALDLFWAKS